MKIFNIIRSQEWWAYKLTPLLAIGYATALMSPIPLYSVALWMAFLLSSLVVGAIYVSVINDITDLEEDLASGKSNRIQNVPPKLRWIIPAACVLTGLIFGFFIYPDILSCALYLGSWVIFSLYSIKPVRLKNRGIMGVLADGCGSHVFTSLLMVSSMSYATHQQINWIWFTAIGLWALCYGLRGILWHQFADRDNDIKVNLNTYASKIEPKNFKYQTRVLIIIELFALAVILYEISIIYTLVAMVLYFILVYIRYRYLADQVIIIMRLNDKPFQILMADYYQLFLPLTLLIFAVYRDHQNIILLIAHVVLFPYAIWKAIMHYSLCVHIGFMHILMRLRGENHK